MLSLLSQLFGIKTSLTKGPDFSQTLTKVIHIEPGIQITYEIPGNMSKMMNFAQRYQDESPRTYKIGINDTEGFVLDQWRTSHKVDGVLWDYIGAKNKGLSGDRGDLNLQVTLDVLPDGDSLEDFIIKAYDNFLNGPDGPNTDIRQSEMGQGWSDEELGKWIIKAPSQIETIRLRGKEFKHFSVTWRSGEYHQYYCRQLSDERFLTFVFRYAVRANSTDDYEEQKDTVAKDISSILDSIAVN